MLPPTVEMDGALNSLGVEFIPIFAYGVNVLYWDC